MLDHSTVLITYVMKMITYHMYTKTKTYVTKFSVTYKFVKYDMKLVITYKFVCYGVSYVLPRNIWTYFGRWGCCETFEGCGEPHEACLTANLLSLCSCSVFTALGKLQFAIDGPGVPLSTVFWVSMVVGGEQWKWNENGRMGTNDPQWLGFRGKLLMSHRALYRVVLVVHES